MFLFQATPSGFLPSEDQGLFMGEIQLPDGSSYSQQGKVNFISYQINPTTDTVLVRGLLKLGPVPEPEVGPAASVTAVEPVMAYAASFAKLNVIAAVLDAGFGGLAVLMVLASLTALPPASLPNGPNGPNGPDGGVATNGSFPAMPQRGLTITRFKGLGEMNAEELRETTLDPENRTLIQVSMRDAGAADDHRSARHPGLHRQRVQPQHGGLRPSPGCTARRGDAWPEARGNFDPTVRLPAGTPVMVTEPFTSTVLFTVPSTDTS